MIMSLKNVMEENLSGSNGEENGKIIKSEKFDKDIL